MGDRTRSGASSSRVSDSTSAASAGPSRRPGRGICALRAGAATRDAGDDRQSASGASVPLQTRTPGSRATRHCSFACSAMGSLGQARAPNRRTRLPTLPWKTAHSVVRHKGFRFISAWGEELTLVTATATCAVRPPGQATAMRHAPCATASKASLQARPAGACADCWARCTRPAGAITCEKQGATKSVLLRMHSSATAAPESFIACMDWPPCLGCGMLCDSSQPPGAPCCNAAWTSAPCAHRLHMQGSAAAWQCRDGKARAKSPCLRPGHCLWCLARCSCPHCAGAVAGTRRAAAPGGPARHTAHMRPAAAGRPHRCPPMRRLQAY